MKTLRDSKVRVVSLEVLRAMCAHVSGSMCRKFSVESVSRSRVHVVYSNEDQWASKHPMTGVYPSHPSNDRNNPDVTLDLLRVIADNQDGDGWQSFEILRNCPSLWRGPPDNAGKFGPFRTHAETLRALHPCPSDKCPGPGCSVCFGYRIDPAHNPAPFCHICAVCDLEPCALRYGVLACPRCGGTIDIPAGDIRDNDVREFCLRCSAATGRLIKRYHHRERMFFTQPEDG